MNIMNQSTTVVATGIISRTFNNNHVRLFKPVRLDDGTDTGAVKFYMDTELLKTMRGFWSMPDGIYDIYKDELTPYGSMSKPDRKLGYTTTLFIESAFKEGAPVDFEIILDSQGFSSKQKKMVYAMIGRCLFPVGHDDFNKTLVFNGKGHGKSTMISAIARLFHPMDVGQIGATTEDYNIHLHDKLLNVAYDLNDHISDWKNMTCGLPVTITGLSKHQSVGDVVPNWTTPMILACNTLPATLEEKYAFVVPMKRRIVVPMTRQQSYMDEDLGQRIEADLATLLRYSVRCYHEVFGPDSSIEDYRNVFN